MDPLTVLSSVTAMRSPLGTRGTPAAALPLAASAGVSAQGTGPRPTLKVPGARDRSPDRSRKVTPLVPRMDTHPPQSSRPRTAVPNTLTATTSSTVPSAGCPVMGDFGSGSARRLMYLGPTTVYRPGGYLDALGADILRGGFLLTYWRRPGAGRSSAAPTSSSHASSWETRSHSSPTMSAAYSLEKCQGSSTQGPAKPDRVGWQRPYTCPPHRSATISRSANPMR
mmetsp:Transcript_20828/g.69899  ORF Transcript_20828/g.69899 Transcript_20828/m.69899 type:complete len:225 (-) Transcript_20828:526-1200(-)